jgi:hypothetical protein
MIKPKFKGSQYLFQRIDNLQVEDPFNRCAGLSEKKL